MTMLDLGGRTPHFGPGLAAAVHDVGVTLARETARWRAAAASLRTSLRTSLGTSLGPVVGASLRVSVGDAVEGARARLARRARLRQEMGPRAVAPWPQDAAPAAPSQNPQRPAAEGEGGDGLNLHLWAATSVQSAAVATAFAQAGAAASFVMVAPVLRAWADLADQALGGPGGKG